MKKGLFAVAVAMLLVVTGFLIRSNIEPDQHMGQMEFAKLLTASRQYARELEAQGKPLPDHVDLQTLIATGHFDTNAAAALQATKVFIALKFDESKPTNVLIRCESHDGYEIISFFDGSVQTRRLKR